MFANNLKRRSSSLTPEIWVNDSPSLCYANKLRKIRRTNNLICFDSPESDTTSPTPRSNRANQKRKTLNIPRAEVCSSQKKITDANKIDIPGKSIDPSDPHDSLKNGQMLKMISTTRVTRNSVSFLSQPNEEKENIEPPPNSEVCKKRKFVKAKRHVRNNHKMKNEVNLQESEDVTVHTVTEEKSIIVETLPSPISPSSVSIDGNYSTIQAEILHFDTSNELLQPSTSGSVEPTRRTYELEDSTIDVSLLKSLSEKDSAPSNNSLSFKTPTPQKFSKVTMRRKWEKKNLPSFTSYNSPSWISKADKSPTQKTSFVKSDQKNGAKSTFSNSKKFVSKIKVPNFAAIHQKALEKIESISDYKERKEERAKMLLSGLKPPAQRKSTKKESRKHLQFAADTLEREKSLTYIPLPNTPMPKKSVRVDESPSPTVVQEKRQKTVFHFGETKFHVAMKQKPIENKVLTPKNSKTGFPFKFAKSNIGSFNFNFGKSDQQVFTLKPNQHKTQLKSVATKTKGTTTTLESRRYAIKGVRSNRRFELLMNMRNEK